MFFFIWMMEHIFLDVLTPLMMNTSL
ncbi:hypothetical protein FPR_22070 [Faecalibacterium prausnitzii SL3/3]|uniref:Uncharacterized protein n=1 Tax=Faecalibacterium prausnitzii SL3/3 TaxID=657322 RepID=D4KC34_9FIRM|nr:hypothetical protein FPR_22070 [Faecalibacterium prausnitzii SL3/3]